MKRVYIAGALNGMAVDYIQNLHRMIKVAEIIRKEGVAVYIPGIDFLNGLVNGDYTYEDYFNNSQPWLDVSDAIFLVPGWEESKGTAREIERAKGKDIPVFEKLDDFVKWLEETENDSN